MLILAIKAARLLMLLLAEVKRKSVIEVGVW